MAYAREIERPDAYHEGAAANRQGQGWEACPYPLGDARRADWMLGWCQAECAAPIPTPLNNQEYRHG